jgi:outer membrane protein TolC
MAHCDTAAEIARTLHADIRQAQADLARRQAEYEDLKGRVAYDVRVTWLDLTASDSSVKVAEQNSAMLHGKTIL